MTRHCTLIGARGFIGSAIAREAQRRGYEVLPVTRENFEVCRGTKTDLLIDANGNSRKYLAEQDPELDFERSVRAVMHTLKAFPSPCYVYLSSMEVYAEKEDPRGNAESIVLDPRSLSPYGFHKTLAEQLVRYHAPSWLILRLAGFCGPGLAKNGLYDLLHGDRMYLHPDSRFQYLHTDDLARMVFDLAEAPLRNEVLNVAGAGTVSLREAAQWIPGRAFTTDDERLPREHRELNIERLQQRTAVPDTATTVRTFIGRVLAGEELLA